MDNILGHTLLFIRGPCVKLTNKVFLIDNHLFDSGQHKCDLLAREEILESWSCKIGSI